jgi:integrase
MFEAAELRSILKAAGVQLRAMILLGINCGFGNSDVGKLALGALDLESGWVNFPRPKTAIARRCSLWPETVKALRASIAARPEPKLQAGAGLVFITRLGGLWAKDAEWPERRSQSDSESEEASPKGSLLRDTPLSKEMAKLLTELKLHRPRLNFYALRHTFETIGGDAKDQVAVDHIMGHARNDMASEYRERVFDERLKAVTDHVRRWLFGKRQKKA